MTLVEYLEELSMSHFNNQFIVTLPNDPINRISFGFKNNARMYETPNHENMTEENKKLMFDFINHLYKNITKDEDRKE